jgi:hypothetical protein
LPIDLRPGQASTRLALHKKFGGRRQGGISPSSKSPNVFLFTDQARGVLHGYIYDGQHSDDFFHYTGEGQIGDQRMVQGNRAIRDHMKEGRELHVFDAGGGKATYMGQFEYVDHYLADAPETGNGRIRSVIVFRLRPVGDTVKPLAAPLDALDLPRSKAVSVEQHLTERMLIEPNREPYEAERREQQLVREFMASLLASGHDVCRLQLQPADEPAPLFCDLFDQTTNTLIEAKGSVARPAFRMAVGQLADYARLIKPSPKKLILVPSKPRPDLLRFAAAEEIDVAWRETEGQFSIRRASA